MKNETHKLHMNLIQQDVYVRDTYPVCDLNSPSCPETFVSLDQVTTPNGVEDILVEKPYPHTQEAVNSYGSCDYHNDIQGAMWDSAFDTRENLGDVSIYQNLNRASKEELDAIISHLLEKKAALDEKREEVVKENE